MKPDEAKLLKQGYPHAEWNETHISYVLMTEDCAYKIMKTVKLDFLDFSTLGQRKHNCEEEQRLNQRLAPDVYRAVVPVTRQGDQLKLEAEGEVLDYAVKMKRLDEQRLMSKLLEKKQVTEQHIRQLAEVVATFHAQAPVVQQVASTTEFAANFNELAEQADWVKEQMRSDCADIISEAVSLSDQFLQQNGNLLKQRQKVGLVRDVHGDLHSHNVFLYDEPVIFDCISFNDAFRKIDLLNEVAFMCMDLEAQGATALSNLFYTQYVAQMSERGIEHVEDENLFIYFKLYRANVRVKVSIIDAQEKEGPPNSTAVKPYLELMKQYTEELV
uniref:Phosphotransferase n=1 Tax=Roseihalotalea indica TaxID=2867963 RepID=A0AA49JEQ0_9BACT|nr:phosphotransferase [Tunicatimonas sp. TK19036]